MTRSDFLDWKQDSRTQEVFKAIEVRCFDIAKDLAQSAGLDPTYDRYRAGIIRGLEQFLEIDFEGDGLND